MKKIKKLLKNWLGITQLETDNRQLKKQIEQYEEQLKTWGMIGIDMGVGEREESIIVIATRAKGGLVKVIRTRQTPSEIIDLMKRLEAQYGIREAIKDFPRGLRW